jgi:hypothetical protein
MVVVGGGGGGEWRVVGGGSDRGGRVRQQWQTNGNFDGCGRTTVVVVMYEVMAATVTWSHHVLV